MKETLELIIYVLIIGWSSLAALKLLMQYIRHLARKRSRETPFDDKVLHALQFDFEVQEFLDNRIKQEVKKRLKKQEKKKPKTPNEHIIRRAMHFINTNTKEESERMASAIVEELKLIVKR